MEHNRPPAAGSYSDLFTHGSRNQVTIQTGKADSGKVDLNTIRQKLRHRLEPSRARTQDNDDQFLPRNALREILTDNTIQLLLKQENETSSIPLTDITGNKMRIKIFAILLLIEKTAYLGHIIRQGVSDDDLPLRPGQLLKTCLGSEESVVEFFRYKQFTVDVPTWDFSAHNIQEKQYDPDIKLPFLTKSEISRGGQGIVWKVKIHCDHYKTRTQSVSWRNPMIYWVSQA